MEMREGTTGHYKLRDHVQEINRKMWPTPRAAIGMGMKMSLGMKALKHKKYLETEVAQDDSTHGGQLNPTWVEWLMGFPIGWTDLNS